MDPIRSKLSNRPADKCNSSEIIINNGTIISEITVITLPETTHQFDNRTKKLFVIGMSIGYI